MVATPSSVPVAASSTVSATASACSVCATASTVISEPLSSARSTTRSGTRRSRSQRISAFDSNNSVSCCGSVSETASVRSPVTGACQRARSGETNAATVPHSSWNGRRSATTPPTRECSPLTSSS